MEFIKGTYIINDDGSLDVDGDVDLSRRGLYKLPFFNKVSGLFNCSCNKLTSLKGSPKSCSDFYCDYNFLTNLEFCPIVVDNDFFCCKNQITTLEYCPKYVGGGFNCSNNDITSLQGLYTSTNGLYLDGNKLTSLIGCPQNIQILSVFYNKITSLEGCPLKLNIIDFGINNVYDFKYISEYIEEVICNDNPVNEIAEMCASEDLTKYIRYLNEFSVIRGNKILGNRLKDCLYMLDLEYIDISKLIFKNYELLE